MARLTMQRFIQLQEMGREPISLPAEIYFGGNEQLQKTPGRHHLKQYQKTGTYNHPLLKAMRKRVAMDAAKRLIENKMTEVELRKHGGIAGLQSKLKEFNYTIDEENMQLAMSNAGMLEEEGRAKREDREKRMIESYARKGQEYKEIVAEPVNPKEDVVKAAIKAKETKLSAADNLSSLKDDSELDNNKDDSPMVSETKDGVGIIELPEPDLETI